MKRYHLKRSVALRLQGIGLILLAYAARSISADDVSILFVILGTVMIMPRQETLTHFLYIIAKRIYRKYRYTEIRGK